MKNIQKQTKGRRNIYWFNSLVTISLIATFILSKFIEIPVEDRGFVGNFIEWFGVLYGFLLPLILVKVWEQFDAIDHEFDSEADAVTILSEDIMLIKQHLKFRIGLLCVLLHYVIHVKKFYNIEANPGEKESMLRKRGSDLLRLARKKYSELVYDNGVAHPPESLKAELLRQINSIIDIRGDRISKAKERLFETLRSLAYITSLAWLVPFYYVNFELGWTGYVLVFIVTFLIMIIISIIEDLDEPYGGVWAVDIDSWGNLEDNIRSYIDELRIDYQSQILVSKSSRKRKSNR